jgi:geranylgeranyl diphosphate synthase type 3
MQRFTTTKTPSLIPLSNLLGIIYQIKDDYLNLTDHTLQQNKGFCEDISEGKFSFPIIHSLRNSSDRTLLGILKQRTQDDQIKRFAVDYLKRTDSFAYTLESLDSVKMKAEKWIDGFKRTCETQGLNDIVEKLDRFYGMVDKLASV